MSENNERPLPKGLCEQCQAEAVKSGKAYCEHNNAGAVYVVTDPDFSAWQIHTPVTREAWEFVVGFMRSVADQMPGPVTAEPEVKTWH